MRDDYSLIPAGQSLNPKSLGFQAQSVRVDNMSNQWLQEETTLTWIPPYTIGRCFSVYGQQTAFILNTTPPGIIQDIVNAFIPQYAVAMFTEAYLNESPGVQYITSLPVSAPARGGFYQQIDTGAGNNYMTPSPFVDQILPAAYNPDLATGRNGVIKSLYLELQRITAYASAGEVGPILFATLNLKTDTYPPPFSNGLVAAIQLKSNVVRDIVYQTWMMDLPILVRDGLATPTPVNGYTQDMFNIWYRSDDVGGVVSARASYQVFEYNV